MRREHRGRRGAAVTWSWLSCEIGNVGQASYTASKSGEFGLAKTLAREAALALRLAGTLEKGISLTVNRITPGLI